MSFSPDQYRLVDFGRGRKLERFGEYLLDRTSPAAYGEPGDLRQWSSANARYSRSTGETGVWQPTNFAPPNWTVSWNNLTFRLKPNSFGHVGLFPEHAAHWQWLTEKIAAHRQALPTPPKVLNLFAYTGGATLAAAAAGAQVTHIDAAKNVVGWARENAALSQLEAAPVRWIAEDAAKFVAREVKRGNRYQGIILDPPSYGHGTGGQRWQIDDDLEPLLANCMQLLEGPSWLLASSHSQNWGERELTAAIKRQKSHAMKLNSTESMPMQLTCSNGRQLEIGAAVRAVLAA